MRLPGGPRYNLELINGIQNPLSGVRIVIDKSETVKIVGWAVDEQAQQQAGGVEVRIDGKPYPAQFGMVRADVAAAFHMPSYEKSGYTFALPAAQLGTGRHMLSIRVISHDGKSYLEGNPVSFQVT